MGNYEPKFLPNALLLSLALSLLGLSFGCNRDPNARKLKFLAAGDRAFQHEKFAEAVIDYGRALQIDPHFAEAHYKLAQCYLKQELWAVAYQELLRTVNLRPDDWAAQLDLGHLLLMGGKGQDAKDRALLILQSNPENSDAQILLSAADALLGNSKEALEEAQAAIRMAPDRSRSVLASRALASTLRCLPGIREKPDRKRRSLNRNPLAP